MARDAVGDLIQNLFLVLLVDVRQVASAPLLCIKAERATTPHAQWLGFDGRSSNEAAVREEGLAIVLDSAASQLAGLRRFDGHNPKRGCSTSASHCPTRVVTVMGGEGE